tara:strand:+ start:105 stop:557 length:453 start_codon:yes stop_codon:yes gene_type:complete
MKSCPCCGCELAPSAGGKARSTDQLRRYFAMIRAAFYHWPEAHKRQFSSAEELRAFLQMKAGHRTVGAQIPMAGMSKKLVMLLAEAAIQGAGSYAMPIMHGDTLVIFRPKSVSFAKMAHADFCALSDAVEAIIRAETGLDPDQMLKQTVA